MSVPEVKIFGLQRSGNNYLNLLLKQNYDIQLFGSEASGWKHGMYKVPEILGREVHLIVIVKHPLCWLPSIWRYRGRGKGPFNQFVQETNEVEIWNLMNQHWANVQPEGRLNVSVQYEALLQNAEVECSRIAEVLGLQRKCKEFYVPKGKMHTNNTEGKKVFNREYYLNRQYLTEYSETAMKNVLARIDWETVQAYGYKDKTQVLDATSVETT